MTATATAERLHPHQRVKRSRWRAVLPTRAPVCGVEFSRRTAADTTDAEVLEALGVIRAHAVWHADRLVENVPDEDQTFHAGVRTLALMTGYSPKTCSTSLRRLRDRDVLCLVQPGDGMLASEYRLNVPLVTWRNAQQGNAPLSGNSPCVTLLRVSSAPSGRRVSRLAPDVWSALGHAAGRTYRVLTAEPRTVREIAQAVDRAPDTVRGRLRRLEAQGLAVRQGRRWVRGSARLGAVARKLEVAGRGCQRRWDFAVERVARREAARAWAARRRGIDPETGEVIGARSDNSVREVA
ncbi:MAG: hypothetical protein A3G44_15625 [Candidatus Rokubacteria bacterium RIFCSPLOWO2_12_FULL_73_47]|nr:MAG: hypothetical protein A3G44_15625 [Candidatus Rokubacteria bacterium RIFCSPLOWO2_12_FULL_73_47]